MDGKSFPDSVLGVDTSYFHVELWNQQSVDTFRLRLFTWDPMLANAIANPNSMTWQNFLMSANVTELTVPFYMPRDIVNRKAVYSNTNPTSQWSGYLGFQNTGDNVYTWNNLNQGGGADVQLGGFAITFDNDNGGLATSDFCWLTSDQNIPAGGKTLDGTSGTDVTITFDAMDQGNGNSVINAIFRINVT